MAMQGDFFGCRAHSGQGAAFREINGVKIAAFVKMMPARDSLALRNYIRDNEPGMVMRQEVSCPSCGHVEEVSMPIGVNFLWPNAGR